MITEFIVTVGANVAAFFASLFGVWEAPDWFMNVGPQVQSLIEGADGLGVWADFAFMGRVTTAVLGVWVFCLGIKLLLKAGTHIPGLGGNH